MGVRLNILVEVKWFDWSDPMMTAADQHMVPWKMLPTGPDDSLLHGSCTKDWIDTADALNEIGHTRIPKGRDDVHPIVDVEWRNYERGLFGFSEGRGLWVFDSGGPLTHGHGTDWLRVCMDQAKRHGVDDQAYRDLVSVDDRLWEMMLVGEITRWRVTAWLC